MNIQSRRGGPEAGLLDDIGTTDRRPEDSIAAFLATGGPDSLTVDLTIRIDGEGTVETMSVPVSALRLVCLMARGYAALVSVGEELTIRQAADLLVVSLPFLRGLLDTGEIAHREVGKDRRVRLNGLLDYKDRIHRARSQALDELTAQAQELGMGY